MKINNNVEYVHITLQTYDDMKYQMNFMAQDVNRYKKEKEELEDEVTKLTCQIEKFKSEILRQSLDMTSIENFTLSQCLCLESGTYSGIRHYKYLLELGFTESEIKEYVTKAWGDVNDERAF